MLKLIEYLKQQKLIQLNNHFRQFMIHRIEVDLMKTKFLHLLINLLIF